MNITESPNFRPINLIDINPVRSELTTGANVCLEYRKQKKQSKQSPGIKIVTEVERVATKVRELTSPSEHPVVSIDEPEPETPNTGDTSGKRSWDAAVGKAAEIAGALIRGGESDAVNHHIHTLFEGLRNSDRQERTMKTVEVLYDEFTSRGRM